MREPYNNITTGRFTLSDIELIAQAKMLEQTPTLNWESSDANRATRQAALSVGEAADIASFLAVRARVVQKFIQAKNPTIQTTPVNLTPPMWLTWLLLAISFVAGLATDQLAAQGARINLLSVPFFGILLWNLLVYLMLFISGIKNKTQRDFMGLRLAFSFLQKSFLMKGLAKVPALSTLMMPMLREYSARAFHMAALGFVMGMIVSVLLRGVGTAYVVGWESTWFAESPDVVYQLITISYGLFTNFLGAMPNILEVANLRFDRLAVSGQEASAGLWLLRMIVMLAIFIVIPRLLLVFKHTFKIAQLKRNYPLDLNDRYYDDILKAWRAEELNLDLVIAQTNDNQASIESAYRLAESLGFNLAEVRNHTLDFDVDDIPLTLEAAGRSQQVWVLMNATTTPEVDVHGKALGLIRQTVGKAPIVLLIDMAGYLARFGDLSDRIQTRRELWEDFALQCEIPVVFIHSGLKPTDKICEELKLACGQPA